MHHLQKVHSMKYSTMAEVPLSIQATFLYQLTQHDAMRQAVTKLFKTLCRKILSQS